MAFVGSLYRERSIKTWLRDRPEGWVITSGDWSPFYFAFRDVPSHPMLFAEATRLLATSMLKWEGEYDRVIGVANTGIALTGAAANLLGVPMGFTRKILGVRTSKDLVQATAAWGGHSLVEGLMRDGDRILVADDVLSTFASKATAIAQIEMEAASRGVHVDVVGVAVVVDRGAVSRAATPVPVTSALNLVERLDDLEDYGASRREVEIIRSYLENPSPFQDAELQASLKQEALGSN